METLILVCVIVVILFSMALVVLSRYKKCPSDKIMVIYGKVGNNKDAPPAAPNASTAARPSCGR